MSPEHSHLMVHTGASHFDSDELSGGHSIQESPLSRGHETHRSSTRARTLIRVFVWLDVALLSLDTAFAHGWLRFVIGIELLSTPANILLTVVLLHCLLLPMFLPLAILITSAFASFTIIRKYAIVFICLMLWYCWHIMFLPCVQ